MSDTSTGYSTLIGVDSLRQLLGRPGCAVFDCRFDLVKTGQGRQAYLLGHIPGATYAHLDDDLSAPRTGTNGRHPLPDAEVLADWLGRHGVGDDTQVVVYDDTGGTIAARLWWMLHWLGHPRAALLDGGFQAWTAAGAPVEPGPSAPRPARFVGRPDAGMWVDADHIQHQPPGRLLDVRTGERYRGEHEPIDPVAGHIPGAVNLPLQRNLGPDGRFLDPASLERLYAPILPPGGGADTVCYCGSGVTACHSILALRVAGQTMPRLYPGSWSEWIADPGHPVATGDV